MSYTNPDGQPQGLARQMTDKLREILIAEVIAINGYQSHISNSNIIEINNAWHSIMLDEKKHYGWVLRLIRKYDPEQQRQYLLHKDDNSGKTPIPTPYMQFSNDIILNNIREDVKGELEAVVLYDDELNSLTFKDVRSTIQDIISEEKGHAEHLTRLLLKYDPDAYDELT